MGHNAPSVPLGDEMTKDELILQHIILPHYQFFKPANAKKLAKSKPNAFNIEFLAEDTVREVGKHFGFCNGYLKDFADKSDVKTATVKENFVCASTRTQHQACIMGVSKDGREKEGALRIIFGNLPLQKVDLIYLPKKVWMKIAQSARGVLIGRYNSKTDEYPTFEKFSATVRFAASEFKQFANYQA